MSINQRRLWPKAAFLASVIATVVMANSIHAAEHNALPSLSDDQFFLSQNPVAAHLQSSTLGL